MDDIDYSTLSIKELRDLHAEYKNKAKLYDTKQHAMKIVLNAAYGANANKYFKYYSIENASAITTTGQVVIQIAAKAVNEYLNKILKTDNESYVVYIDTDSNYICLEKLIDKMFPGDQSDINKIVNFIDKFVTEKLEKEIEKTFEAFKDKLNHRQNKISFKRESIADKAIFKAKKKYFLNVWDNEGVRYSEPDLKVAGIEVVRSSTPKFCKNRLKEALNIIINGDNKQLKEYIKKCRKEFKAAPLSDISYPRGINDINKYNLESNHLPIHIRASLHYNKMIRENDSMKHLSGVKNGQKIKYIYIREPNHIRSNVIGFIDDLSIEFDLHRYIDYKTQFDKSFLEPLRSITSLIGWDVNIDGLTFN